MMIKGSVGPFFLKNFFLKEYISGFSKGRYLSRFIELTSY